MNKKYLICVIIVFFLATRLYKINIIPPSLYWDEASIAYNAYSILQTGKDEWGKSFPLHFRAFGEFKLPLYIYTTSIFEFFGGLNELSVRLPSVIFSATSIFLIYLLAAKLFNSENVALLSALFLTISPWSFIFTRTGYEVSAGLTFFLLGIYSWFLSRQRPLLFVISALSFGLSLYSYNSFRLIIPLTLLCLSITFRLESKFLRRAFLPYAVAILLITLAFIPVVKFTLLNPLNSRFATVGIFGTTSQPLELWETFIGSYLSHFNPRFLFMNGDINLRSQLSNWGQLYLIDSPLLVLGLASILKRWKQPNFLFPLLMIFLGPIPAALTKESPHALRSISMLPFISVVTALGVERLANFLKHKTVFYLILALIYFGFFGFYFKDFTRSYPQKSALSWQYPYKQIFTNYREGFSKFDHVVVSDTYGQPYIFALYYLKYDPAKFWSTVKLNPPDKWGFSRVSSFDKFIFMPVEKDKLPGGKSLIFAPPKERLERLKRKETLLNLDGTTSWEVYTYEN